MKLTYIFHSGFALESDSAILIFDYWMDPRQVLEPLLSSSKPMYVFASHFHEDHFTKEIFEWRKVKDNITYILSRDIMRHRRAEQQDADVWMVRGDQWKDDLIHVLATGSTDVGVSWIVEVDGRRIFHAGDLNNWYAKYLADEENVPETIISEDFGEIHPLIEEKRYLGELKVIRKLCKEFDLVMFPVDGRIGNGYTRGPRQFLDRFTVRRFVPMHFTTSGFESAWRFREYAEAKNVLFWSIEREGETIDFR